MTKSKHPRVMAQGHEQVINFSENNAKAILLQSISQIETYQDMAVYMNWEARKKKLLLDNQSKRLC